MQTDVVIIGASAAGLMCAAEAGRRGRRVVVLDHANRAGKKILMSGGGRCNFTNLDVSADNYISDNPHFCKSALSRYTQWDFIALVDRYGIPWHERDHGQLFCNDSARDILDMLLNECRKAGVEIRLNCAIDRIDKTDAGFTIDSSKGMFKAGACVIATGGLSIPRMCASPFGYQVAGQFGHRIVPTRPGLVPFTLQPGDKARFAELAGIAVDSQVSNARITFRENLLFTHRGLSGPAILQMSSYWQPGEAVSINLLPDLDAAAWLKTRQAAQPNSHLKTVLSEWLPKRLISAMLGTESADQPLQSLSHRRFEAIAESLQHWQLRPNGTEGYRTAEVTVGGVDCDELSSKTLESKRVAGLYFVGEVVDVTGWLGGYNFQWAWSSGWAAGQVV
ncbi:oxidoreductase [Thiohalobacter thiocyanaticus]|uniref:Oxidoreductase n=1 Tax=Thiohalobacter thiocyanaticus TaxID=585455 RepID=A0A1Z4VUB1_9GAMM|nr:NAD(P)/FAD-dependent oxidoreductase [Thiohalobacter thiocyanaticus]BAZ94784.1 oxidoreductase [Thiohalobacter thiocyanaticus]